jgi:hypothetical protein
MDSSRDFVKAPIFLVGSERSGTTLTRIMLDSHPKIAFFFEFEYSILSMSDDGTWPDLDEYKKHLRSDRIFRHAKLSIDEGLDYPGLVDSFLVQKRDRDRKPIVGATVHYHFDRLLKVWPDARFIHLLRDGRDVARSIIEMGWAGNMYSAVEPWIEAETLWARLAPTLPDDRRIELRYEDLVSRPEEELTRVCDWIGVPYDPAMLAYSENGGPYGPPSVKAIGQWKRKLPPSEVALAEYRIGDMLEARGYELSGFPRPEVSPARRRLLKLQDRLGRANFRRKRYGTMLHLAHFVSRVGRMRPVHDWTARRIEAIDVSYIK